MPGSSTGMRRGRAGGVAIRPEAIRQAREEAGLSLAQVAGDDLSRTAIHLIEKGRMRPSRRTLQLIASRTGHPISYFLADGGATASQRTGRDEVEHLVTTGQFEAAIEVGERLLGDPMPARIEAEVRLQLSKAYYRLQQHQRAEPHAAEARALFEAADDREMMVEALAQQASALKVTGDRRALPLVLEALDLCERLQPPQPALMADVLVKVGSLYGQYEQWPKAAEAFKRGLGLAREHPDVRQIALLHEGLGVAYGEIGKLELSRRHITKGLRLYQGTGDPVDLLRAEHNAGELLLRQGDVDGAEPHLRRSLEWAKQHDLPPLTITFTSLAEVHLERGELDLAEARLLEALDAARAKGEMVFRALAHSLWCKLCLRRSDIDGALRAGALAVDGFQGAGDWDRVRDCHTELAEALEQSGRFEESIIHWRAAVEATKPQPQVTERTASQASTA